MRTRRPSRLAEIVGLGALAVLCAASCAKLEARELVRDGNGLYSNAKYAKAIEAYTQAIELEPDGVTVFWNRAAAAESLVLQLKNPEDREDRKKYADMALRDYQTWHDRLLERTPEDEQQLADHRLAILDADERCDDLLSYWLDKHRQNPGEESLYGVIGRQYERCGRAADVALWMKKRTEDFPHSVRAWHGLAVHQFDPLWPAPDSTLPFNEAVAPDERLRVADVVIATLDKATAIDPKFRDAYVWRSMAYAQKSLARVVIDDPETPEERLEPLLAREDSLAGWKQQKAVCDLEQLPDCPEKVVPTTPCCPLPPISPSDQAKDAELKKELLAELAKRDASEQAKAARKGGRARG